MLPNFMCISLEFDTVSRKSVKKIFLDTLAKKLGNLSFFCLYVFDPIISALLIPKKLAKKFSKSILK